MNNAEFDDLIAMVSDGRISRTEFLLKMQLRPLVVENILTLHKLPAAVTRNIDIGDLMFSDDEELNRSMHRPGEENDEDDSPMPKKRCPIPEGITWDAEDQEFYDLRAVPQDDDFYKTWIARASEFPDHQ